MNLYYSKIILKLFYSKLEFWNSEKIVWCIIIVLVGTVTKKFPGIIFSNLGPFLYIFSSGSFHTVQKHAFRITVDIAVTCRLRGVFIESKIIIVFTKREPRYDTLVCCVI